LMHTANQFIGVAEKELEFTEAWKQTGITSESIRRSGSPSSILHWNPKRLSDRMLQINLYNYEKEISGCLQRLVIWFG
jgi:hypothetical protein